MSTLIHILSRSFINHENGKCSRQVVGVNNFGTFFMEIGQYLNVPFSKEHSFCTTSTSLQMDAEGNLLQLKHHEGWRSSNIAERYTDKSSSSKI